MAGRSFSPFSALARFVQVDLFEELFPQPAGEVVDNAPKKPPSEPTSPKRGVLLGDQFVPYQLQRSKRRSIGFLIADDGLRITAPRWVTIAAINEAILSKQRWILTKLQEQQDRPAPQEISPTIWHTGSTLPFLGTSATLHVEFGSPSDYNPETATITLNLPSDASATLCKKHLQMWLMNQARRTFSQRLPHFAELLGVRYHSFTLTSANTRWGSCNNQGKIRLNWRLIHFSPHLIDYVIAHELAHLLEMNHSPRFWATVERVFPDYLAARNELKQLGLQALPQF